VLAPHLQAKLKDFLELQLADTVKGWWMQPDGSYMRVSNKDFPGRRFQERFYEILQAENRSLAAKGINIDGSAVNLT
jgi:polyphosphate kinase